MNVVLIVTIISFNELVHAYRGNTLTLPNLYRLFTFLTNVLVGFALVYYAENLFKCLISRPRPSFWDICIPTNASVELCKTQPSGKTVVE
jgi:hypothetical protein